MLTRSRDSWRPRVRPSQQLLTCASTRRAGIRNTECADRADAMLLRQGARPRFPCDVHKQRQAMMHEASHSVLSCLLILTRGSHQRMHTQRTSSLSPMRP